MGTLRIILGDQLTPGISCLTDADPSADIILMAEVHREAVYVKHHKKKIAYIFSAMRHFAGELEESGYRVRYTELDDEQNTGSFSGEVERALGLHGPAFSRIVATHPGEYRVLQEMKSWETRFSIPLEIRPDNRFLCSPREFARWAGNRKQLRMENFYREMRRKHRVLMERNSENEPLGGRWNFDAENRKPPAAGLTIPAPYRRQPDTVTEEVLELVEHHFNHHFGDLRPFTFAVDRPGALAALNQFIEERLAGFGDYQDAMLEDEPWMYHSHLALYLNSGLLLPRECIAEAEAAYHAGRAPLNAVEGFIRQIIGWREYIRGVYWLKMPAYAEENYFGARRKLPDFYWSGDTPMNCLRQCVRETRRSAYAHHIQRLMVLGNFALLAGIHPRDVNEWFLVVYADAYEWVELPNVSGMALFADGGCLASKPYAAGGAYIGRMSNYCRNCRYKVSKKNGPDACPFNYLYWDFLSRNRAQLEHNPRIAMMLRTYDRMSSQKKQAVARDSARFLNDL